MRVGVSDFSHRSPSQPPNYTNTIRRDAFAKEEALCAPVPEALCSSHSPRSLALVLISAIRRCRHSPSAVLLPVPSPPTLSSRTRRGPPPPPPPPLRAGASGSPPSSAAPRAAPAPTPH